MPSPSLYLSPSLDNRQCVHGRVLSPELTPQGISRFLCVDCVGQATKTRQGYPLASPRYTGLAASQKTPLIRERPGNPSRESPFAKWFSNIGSMYASCVINPSLSAAIFRDIRRIACFSFAHRFSMHGHESPWILSTRFFFFFFIFDSDVPSTRDGIPFPIWIRNREGEEKERGRIVSFKDRWLFLKRSIVRQSLPFSFPFIFVFFLYEISDWKIPISYVPLWFIEGREDFSFFLTFYSILPQRWREHRDKFEFEYNLNIRINLIFNSLNAV